MKDKKNVKILVSFSFSINLLPNIQYVPGFLIIAFPFIGVLMFRSSEEEKE